MDRLLEESGVELENRARVRKIVETLKRDAGCTSFSVVNVGESPDMLLKLYDPDVGLMARKAFSSLTSDCRGVRNATVIFPRSGIGAPLEIHVSVLKEGRRGIERYAPAGPVDIYLIERLRAASGGRDLMPRALLLALKGVATEVIGYCKPKLDLRLTHAPGEPRCVATFVGARECSLSFLEHLFEMHGRRLVDVEFRSSGVERAIVAHLDVERVLPTFPRRKEERAIDERSKRSRVV